MNDPTVITETMVWAALKRAKAEMEIALELAERAKGTTWKSGNLVMVTEELPRMFKPIDFMIECTGP